MPHITVQHSGMNLDLDLIQNAIQSLEGNNWWFLDPTTLAEMPFTPGEFCLIAPRGDNKNCLEPKELNQRKRIVLSPINRERLSQQWRFVDVASYHPNERGENIPNNCTGWYYIINHMGRVGTRPHWSMGVSGESLAAKARVVLWQVANPNVQCPGNHWWRPV